MPLRFSANISMLFQELPFLERIAAAARAGFDAVECHFPYDTPPGEVVARLRDSGLVMNGINTPPGDLGTFGLAAQPGAEAAFARALDDALAYAQAVGAQTIHCMSGVTPPERRAAARDVFLGNMARAAPLARAAGVTLLLEPINRYDRPDYFISRSDEAADLLRTIDDSAVKMMFDVYHVQIMEGDVLRRMERFWPLIGHFQFASVPERAEPDLGELRMSAIFEAIARGGWDGFVGAEYRPRGATLDGLGWLADARR
ncbi:MAG TPA: TIM barrel protein [Beijerinckiaceae bacterium]|jgi:hydroxypyruvate isomerase